MSTNKKKQKGPVFLQYVVPIVDTLKQLGNSGTSGEVSDLVIEQLGLSQTEQTETVSNGQSRVRNQIGWARFYLAKAGYLDASQRGVWTLTELGRTSNLDADAVHALFKAVHKQFPRKERGAEDVEESDDDDDEEGPEAAILDYKARLLTILRALPPSGFEKICQRLLRESGFQQVVITGRSNDGGIDGHGVLEINPLVTFRVLFQCKRYRDGARVVPSTVRDFRGAMQGRADKGLILTTGAFTSEARKEATRDGAPPIELVDGEKLVTMFERAELGLRPVPSFEINDSFFEEFRK
jgi:restriction system protein